MLGIAPQRVTFASIPPCVEPLERHGINSGHGTEFSLLYRWFRSKFDSGQAPRAFLAASHSGRFFISNHKLKTWCGHIALQRVSLRPPFSGSRPSASI